jgi:putative ABC transport system permease protein
MGAMRDSLRNGLRFAKTSPGITVAAAMILALGIGASTAVFSVLYAVSFQPLPYENPDQLVELLRTESYTFSVESASRSVTVPSPLVPGPDFLRWARQSDVFSVLGAAKMFEATAKAAGRTEQLRGYAVTPGFLEALGVHAAKGRLLAAGDEQPGREHAVVLGPGYASNSTGEGAAGAAKRLVLDGQAYDVIGNVPSSFRFPSILFGASVPKPDVLVPIPIAQLNVSGKPNSLAEIRNSVMVIGRLKPGVTITQAQSQMTTISNRLAKQDPEADAGFGVQVVSLQSQVSRVSGVLLSMLLLGVGCLLLIACVNIAVLMLAQGARRQHEIAIRLAVGASPARILGQLFSESLMLALTGGVLGVALAFWLKDALLSVLPARMIPQMNPIEMNWQVLVFALAVSVAAAVAFGLAPALELSRVDANQMLKEGDPAGSAGVRPVRLRNVFVVCEVTLALCLLILCGLMVRGMSGVFLGSQGFNPKRMLLMVVTPTDPSYAAPGDREGFYRELLSRVDGVQGVESATLNGIAYPMNGNVASADKPITLLQFRQGLMGYFSDVTPGYFRTMQIRLLRGRTFTWADCTKNPTVAIVNSSLAQAIWPGQDPMGKHITVSYPPEPYEVVGVVADGGFGAAGMVKGMPVAYFPKLSPAAWLLVRASGDAKGALATVRSVVTVIGGVRVRSPMTMEQYLTRTSRPIRYVEDILGFLALLALLLATVGVFAVTAYSVTQRTHEIGVRMALGARPGQVLSAVMREGVRLSLYGVAIGLVLALGVGQVLMHFLRGVGIGSLWTYFEVSLLMLAVAAMASYIAARRATHIDPIAALRCE